MTDVIEARERGRAAYARRAWSEAHDALALADAAEPLAPDDLERLATAAYMLGRDDAHAQAMERAHHRRLGEDDVPGAARCAFWIGIHLLLRGEGGPAAGWFGRAGRLLERAGRDCVESGFLLIPRVFEHAAAGERDAAIAVAGEAAAIGERFGEPDLFALASHEQGLLLIRDGRVAEGLRLLDEAMVAVTAGELSPIVNGFVYCGVITGCQAAYEPRRAQEWTAALTRWCAEQPDLVSFSGTCLVHRAEIMQLRGAWPDALAEARRAAERSGLAANRAAAAEAAYRQGEVHRLRGESAAAEAAYHAARRDGHEPQPGLALLRLDEGNGDAAAAAIRRALSETTDRAARAGLLPAYVEIMLATGDLGAARAGCDELDAIAGRWRSDLLGAMAAHARGAVALADGDARAALVSLRRAAQAWRALEAPYETARARVLVGLACRALGDGDTAGLELAAAADAFAELGAAPDLARARAHAGAAAPRDAYGGLTTRELEVLRLVAAGRSNRAIAAELVISEHTVARHVQNLFAKLGVSSRAAATAAAFEHELL
jgi:DNA-binding CsgD family transcriptional regulator